MQTNLQTSHVLQVVEISRGKAFGEELGCVPVLTFSIDRFWIEIHWKVPLARTAKASVAQRSLINSGLGQF